ncbi:MAG: manganese efflux pump [Lachnospiraceae bacterium]|nr:manganese efflux pump [Lachnospiraceae bacterium]
MDFLFIINSALLGVGLAMDAFSVSIVNGLNEPGMRRGKMCGIAGTYAGFQFLMPMLGWFCVHTIATLFDRFQKYIPWIALLLLCWIGGEMLISGIKSRKQEDVTETSKVAKLGLGTLLMQGVATSIDALSVGFTIASYGPGLAFACSLIIAAVTFVICMCGLLFGRSFGEKLKNRAQILGGIILIGIGLEILIKSLLS